MKRFTPTHTGSRAFITDAVMTILLLIGATWVGFGFQRHGFSEANISICLLYTSSGPMRILRSAIWIGNG